MAAVVPAVAAAVAGFAAVATVDNCAAGLPPLAMISAWISGRGGDSGRASIDSTLGSGSCQGSAMLGWISFGRGAGRMRATSTSVGLRAGAMSITTSRRLENRSQSIRSQSTWPTCQPSQSPAPARKTSA